MKIKNSLLMFLSMTFFIGCFSTVKLKKLQCERVLAYKTENAIFYVNADEVLKMSLGPKKNFTSSDSAKLYQKINELKSLKVNDTMLFVENSGFGTFQVYVEVVIKSSLKSGKLNIYDVEKKMLVNKIFMRHEKNIGCDWTYIYNRTGRNELWYYCYNCPAGHF